MKGPLVIVASLLAVQAAADVQLEPGFWDDYVPYRQYSEQTLSDLRVLQETDLLETGRDIDGLEFRVMGRNSSTSSLISARVVIDSVLRLRMQVKVAPSTLSPNDDAEPPMQRTLLSTDQAETLLRLLEDWGFWDAPYALDRPAAARGLDCSNAGEWLVEAIRPGTYQLVSRSTCGGLEPAVAEIRDFLLGLVDVRAD
jgi:hypothetical protein